MKTREEALRDLGRVIADEIAEASCLSVEDAARRAYHQGGPPLADLMTQIAAVRSGTPDANGARA